MTTKIKKTKKAESGKAKEKATPQPEKRMTAWQAALNNKGTGEILDMRAVLK